MIFDIKKRTRVYKGKKVYSRCYSLYYRFGDMASPKWFALKLSDKEAATAKAHEFRKEYEAEASGIILPKAIREAAKKPLRLLIDDYVQDLKKRVKTSEGKTPKQTKSRLLRLTKECKWLRIGDISAESFIKWRSETNLAVKTLNHYLSEAVTLVNWLVKTETAMVNPLAQVAKLSTKGRETRLRRAFSDIELQGLLKASPDY